MCRRDRAAGSSFRVQVNAAMRESFMTRPIPTGVPVDVAEADLLEQQIPWQEPPEDPVSSAAESPLAVADRSADAGDLLEQARAAVTEPDDDDHPYGEPN
jgi:hypothetical protein